MYESILVILIVSIAIGLLRVLKGPDEADRMLACQLFATTGIAILLVLGQMKLLPSAINIALCFALLAPITLIAFIRISKRQ